LKSLENLSDITLASSRVTGPGLEHLKGLTSLRRLDLWNTKLNDDGLKHVAELEGLIDLNIGGTQVTNEGVASLKRLTNLTKLDIKNTAIDASGLQELREALPNCEIVHEVPENPEQTQAKSLAKQFDTNYAQVQEALKHSPDPTLRSFLIHELAPSNVDPKAVIKRLLEEDEVSVRRALILALGEYTDEKRPASEREKLIPLLLSWYKDDVDSGIHSCCDWLLRKWGQEEAVKKIDKELATGEIIGDRKWYVNKIGMTFAVLEMEGHRFAVGLKEVAVQDFVKFRKDHPYDSTVSPLQECPVNKVEWYESCEYANWLSEQEGLPKQQLCYEPNSNNEYDEGMKVLDARKRQGYRLLEGREWEFACRANSTTLYYFGRDLRLLANYGWYKGVSKVRTWPVGSLKPNDFGLFDVSGNVWEWCQDRDDSAGNIAGSVKSSVKRCQRGGAFHYDPICSESGYIAAYSPLSRHGGCGIRLGRTLLSSE